MDYLENSVDEKFLSLLLAIITHPRPLQLQSRIDVNGNCWRNWFRRKITVESRNGVVDQRSSTFFLCYGLLNMIYKVPDGNGIARIFYQPNCSFCAIVHSLIGSRNVFLHFLQSKFPKRTF